MREPTLGGPFLFPPSPLTVGVSGPKIGSVRGCKNTTAFDVLILDVSRIR